MPMAIIAKPKPPPRTAAMTSARIRNGKAWMLSTTRITIHSSQNPLKYPLTRPRGTPTPIASPTEMKGRLERYPRPVDDAGEDVAAKGVRAHQPALAWRPEGHGVVLGLGVGRRDDGREDGGEHHDQDYHEP